MRTRQSTGPLSASRVSWADEPHSAFRLESRYESEFSLRVGKVRQSLHDRPFRPPTDTDVGGPRIASLRVTGGRRQSQRTATVFVALTSRGGVGPRKRQPRRVPERFRSSGRSTAPPVVSQGRAITHARVVCGKPRSDAPVLRTQHGSGPGNAGASRMKRTFQCETSQSHFGRTGAAVKPFKHRVLRASMNLGRRAWCLLLVSVYRF